MNDELVTLSITMTHRDAEAFIEDWELCKTAPVLTGGYMENTVYILEVEKQ
ncbi:MAG: hypothetical protein JWO15_3670 [Sphingomonadales bacterium]|nr:hypothetical protein [Sphingomonadales bacterium]